MDHALLATFSARLQEAMEAAGVNQNALAGRLGITRAGMGNLYHGTSGPSVGVLVKLSHELSVSSDWLLGISKRKKASP
jgi:transcriptional regulator with XRE-family HTH domain